MIKTISIVGSGNVAYHLGKAFVSKGLTITDVYSRNANSSKQLSQQLQSVSVNKLTGLSTQSDLIVIAVNDDSIEEVCTALAGRAQMIVHTSGCVDMNVFKNNSDCGVLYPLQSLSKKVEVSLKGVPIFIEGSTEQVSKSLLSLANSISGHAIRINSEQRKALHLAAVFANNFSNHLFCVAEEILQEKSLSLELLSPIINTMVSKIGTNSPKDRQTGPAVRNDIKTMAMHSNQLNDEQHKNIYSIMSRSIHQMSKNKPKN